MKSLLFLTITLFLFSCLSLAQSLFINVIDFDGDGDYAYTVNEPVFPTSNGTIEVWIKVRNIRSGGQIIGDAFFAKNEEQWNVGDFYMWFESASGKLKASIHSPPSQPPIETDIQSNISFWSYYDIWFHTAFTWGSSGMKLFINGIMQSSQSSVTHTAMTNSCNFYIGTHGYKLLSGNYNIKDFFNGQIDEVRIWNYQKNSQQINTLMNAPLDSTYFVTIDSGLVGYWRFDVLEDLGINNDGPDDVRDLSVLHNHLDLAGDAHLVQPDPIIPVELISFIAKPMNGQIILQWITATEINNFGFELERCTEDRAWRTVGFTEGSGTSTDRQQYQIIDDLFGVNARVVFYRLKQIDYNGKFEYSSELEVFIPPAEFNLFQNYPNPFNPTTTICYSIPEKQLVTLNIYNSLGEVVSELVKEEKEAGVYEIEFNGANLPNGVYFYSLSSGDFYQTKKLILLK